MRLGSSVCKPMLEGIRWQSRLVVLVWSGCAVAQVGAGVLGLPYAFKYLLWPGGIIVIVLSYVISLYTLW